MDDTVPHRRVWTFRATGTTAPNTNLLRISVYLLWYNHQMHLLQILHWLQAEPSWGTCTSSIRLWSPEVKIIPLSCSAAWQRITGTVNVPAFVCFLTEPALNGNDGGVEREVICFSWKFWWWWKESWRRKEAEKVIKSSDDQVEMKYLCFQSQKHFSWTASPTTNLSESCVCYSDKSAAARLMIPTWRSHGRERKRVGITDVSRTYRGGRGPPGENIRVGGTKRLSR